MDNLIPTKLPNAPKHQPCESCGRRTRRIKKSPTTATYYCSVCKTTTIISIRR